MANVEPIDPDFPPLRVEPWNSLQEQHEAHAKWRRDCRELTKRMRLTGPATDGTRRGFFHRGVFIDSQVSRGDVERAFDSRK